MNAGVTVSYLGTNTAADYLVSNALKNIVVLFYGDTKYKTCVQIDEHESGGVLATFSIKFKAQVPINGVAVLPGYGPSNLTSY
jgi:hypothetical protein